MVTTSTSISLPITLSPPPLSSILRPKCRRSLNTYDSSFSITSPLIFQPTFSSKRATCLHIPPPCEIPLKSTQIRRVSAASGDALPPEANPVESSQEIVSSVGDDGVSYIISVLLFIAFIGLSILTIGVIYIAVTDFLQKRERERFEKETAAEKKKSRKKGKVRARDGPRGFGQKLEEEEEY